MLEVRDTSLVVLWDPPAFSGRSPVSGYYLDIKEAVGGAGAWRAVHEKVCQLKYMKVTDARGRTEGGGRVAVTGRFTIEEAIRFLFYPLVFDCENVTFPAFTCAECCNNLTVVYMLQKHVFNETLPRLDLF